MTRRIAQGAGATLAGALVVLALAGSGGARPGQSVTCSSTAPASRVTLTGSWRAADGPYSLLQLGSCLWWVGGATRSNVFFGSVFSSTVTGTWADLLTRRSGTLTLLVGPNTLRLAAQTGGFRTTAWQRGP
jgi:hypothetical protein